MTPLKTYDRVRVCYCDGRPPTPGHDIGNRDCPVGVGAEGRLLGYSIEQSADSEAILEVRFDKNMKILVRRKFLEPATPSDGIPDLP